MFVIAGIACLIMVYFGIAYMVECIVHGVTDVRAVTIPKWTVFIIIPIGSILLTIQFFRMAWGKVISTKAGR
jgi:TRAP-type mannitol/chloroaromatic compound transport system permease small subunit